MTKSEFKKKLLRIQKAFNQAEEVFNSLPTQYRDEILNIHNEEASLNHCIRWGNQAISEILLDYKKIHEFIEEVY